MLPPLLRAQVFGAAFTVRKVPRRLMLYVRSKLNGHVL
jgi:hypothetical protein